MSSTPTKNKNEISTKNKNEISTMHQDMDWGSSNMDSTDLVIPKLWVIQKTSRLFDEGHANIGDICNSSTGQVIGGLGTPIVTGKPIA